MARTWLQVEGVLYRHPKVDALCELYDLDPDIGPYVIVGFLLAWWGHCAEMGTDGQPAICPRSRLARLWAPVLHLARGVTVPEIHEALATVRLMDPDGRPHDWQDYSGALLERRAKDKARQVARRTLIGEGSLTAKDWLELLGLCGHRCAYCGAQRDRLGQDHIIPLCKGGTHSADNVLPCCKRCNTKKGKRLLNECGMGVVADILAALQPTRFAGVLKASNVIPMQSRAEQSREKEKALSPVFHTRSEKREAKDGPTHVSHALQAFAPKIGMQL